LSGIRVTYSGLISFVVGLVSVFTGLGFTLIITRELSPEEFGTWSIIGGLTGYVLILEPIISYWTTREIARGRESGRTALLSSNLFSGISSIAYIIIILGFVTLTDVDQEVLLFAVILIPVLFVRHTLTAINQGHKPQTGQFGYLAFELTKIPVALLLIYFLQMGIYGVILTAFIASLVSIVVQLSRTSHKLRGKFKKETLKWWLKFFWLPIYPRISGLMLISDIIIVTLILGTVEDIAYWAAAFAVASIVLIADRIATPLYPKLLQGGRREYFQENLIQVFYFAFPLCSMTIIFARPALFVLNPLYESALSVVIILTFVMFVRMLGGVFQSPLVGIEEVDKNKNSTFKDYLKSKLFYLPTLTIIQQVSYLGSLVIMLLLFADIEPRINLIIYWAIVALITQIPFTAYLYLLIKRDFSPKINHKAISKYLGTCFVIFGLTYFFMDNYLVYTESIFEFLPQFMPFAVLSFGSYLVITFIVDRKTKKLFKSVVKEIFKK